MVGSKENLFKLLKNKKSSVVLNFKGLINLYWS